MADFDIKEFTEQLKHLTVENQKLQSMKERYIQHSQKMRALSEKASQLADEIEGIADEIDPVSAQSKRERKPYLTEILNVFYEKIMKGTHVTRTLIEQAYPNLKNQDVAVLLMRLADMPNVMKTKDGKAVRLYAKEGI